MYKYLGTIIDDNLTFNDNTVAICEKAQQRLRLLRKLNWFGMCSKLMTLFFSSMVESVITFSIMTWFGNL